MGCTEGNIYGLWNGRDYLAGKFLLDDSAATTKTVTSEETAVMRRRLIYQQALPTTENPNAYVPIAFYSDDTHYSIIKAVQMLEISTFYEIGSKFYPKDNPLAPGQPWPKEVPSLRKMKRRFTSLKLELAPRVWLTSLDMDEGLSEGFCNSAPRPRPCSKHDLHLERRQRVLVQILLSVCFYLVRNFADFRRPEPRPKFPERCVLFRLVV